MTPKHILLIAGCLVGVGAMTGSLHSWDEALKPSFIGGALAVIGTQLGAIFSEKPGQ